MDNPVKNPGDERPIAPSAPRLMPALTAAEHLGVHSATLIRWAKQGRIPAYATPGRARTSWLFDVNEITKVMRENSQQIAKNRHRRLEFLPLPREKIAEIAREIRKKIPPPKPNREA